MKNLLLSFLCLVAAAGATAQQSASLTGRVTDERGDAMIGVSVAVKGTSTGAITDPDGRFTLNVPALSAQTVLQVTYLGYKTQDVTVGQQRTFDIRMHEDANQIEGVVVTALGILKKEKSLTYSTQIVDGGELTRAKDPNMINALAGKTAGVQISKSASGLGGSVKVNIRGSRSIRTDNQPLYVIDGIPIYSSANNDVATTIGGNNDAPNRDGGDGISNLNPDDIESMNILKGPAAAALYGSSAANGVIVITTKKGRAGRTDISFNTNTTWESPTYGIPKFQNSYTGVSSSWGGKIDGSPDYVGQFFQTGVTTINSLSLSAGNEKMQTYFSYANTYGKGVVEGNELKKHNLNFRETAKFLNDRLSVDANINIMYQRLDNRTTPGGFYLNPLVGLYHFPRGGVEGGESFDHYKNNYQVLDPERNLMTQNWYPGGLSNMEQNPFWITKKTPSEDKRVRGIVNLSLAYKFSDRLTLQVRGNADYFTDNYNMKMYAGTYPGLASSNGRYLFSQGDNLVLYGDVLLTWNRQLGDFSISATGGASVKDNTHSSNGLDTYPAPLYLPNIFRITNMNLNAGRVSESRGQNQEQSVFFAAQAGFKDWLFLDVTGRNDWASTMAFTDNARSGFFYPSVGVTWVINQSLRLPGWINLGKVRAAWSEVGSGLPQYVSNPINSVGLGGTLLFNTTHPYSALKPEKTRSVEFGTEWRMWGSRLEADVTWYKTNTRNQLFSMAAPSGSKYNTYYINAGNIQNTGVEVVLSGSPVWTENFRWKTGLNYSHNRNEVRELAPGLDRVGLGGGGSNSYSQRLMVGGSFGDIYGYTFLRDASGNVQYDDAGIPLRDKSEQKKVGNTSPDFNMGWQNTFTYKNFSLYVLVDGRFGGDVISLTEADLDKYGVSRRSGDDRNRGYVDFHGKKIDNARDFYSIVGGRDGITEHYVWDATNVRLREVSLGYSLPERWLDRTFVKRVEVSLIARNLFFVYLRAPYDPDGTMSAGNSLQGVDVFGMPTNRSVGFNVKLNF